MSRFMTTETELNRDTAGKHTDRDRVLIRRKDGIRSGEVGLIGASRTLERGENLSKMAVRTALKWLLIAGITKQAFQYPKMILCNLWGLPNLSKIRALTEIIMHKALEICPNSAGHTAVL
uniref:Uncharacterized protein n=1 Tax=Opuntia streptacantha TaxID=393608 RepID=A0A7C9DS59_OPUST